MIKILFFHGYGSSSVSSGTANTLRTQFGASNVIAPSYDYNNAAVARNQLSKVVAEELKKDPELMLVGTSLGGFWANFFCEKYNLKTVLVNPSLDPYYSLKKYPDADFDSYKDFYTEDTPFKHKIIILGEKDDIIPYTTFLNRLDKYYHYSIFIDKEMGHRISNPNLLIKCITDSYLSIY
jgi:predicted esterase YcpF (UPF0227 family)